MSAQTDISWCDSTVNFWFGCTGISPACANCYAEARMDKRLHKVDWGAGKPRKRTSANYLRDAIKMARRPFYECKACGWRGDKPSTVGGSITDGLPSCPACDNFTIDARRRIFSLSLGDWLDNEVPIDWFADMLDAIRTTPESDWLLLTKRIGNWKRRIGDAIKEIDSDVGDDLRSWLWSWINGHPPANVWLGSTVINQAEADRDVPKLLDVPARIRFLSIEPMLGPVTLAASWLTRTCSGQFLPAMRGVELRGLDWIICGGESGPHARQLDMQWIRSLVLQCKTAGVPIHVKQMGRTPFFVGEGAGWAYDFFGGGDRHWRADYRLPDGSLGVCAFRDREGRNINEWPEDLRVQEFPA